MSSIFLLAGFIACAAFFADKWNWLKKNQYRLGIFFGFLCVITDYFSVHVPGGVLVSIRDVPAIIAAFFFHPLAGIIAGVIASVGRFLLAFFYFSVPWEMAFSSTLVALYAAAMSQWVFERKRPPMIPAAIAAVYGEILHLVCTFFNGIFSGSEPRMLEVLDFSYPLMFGGSALAVVLTSLFCGTWRGWRKNFFNSLLGGLLVFGVSFAVLQIVSLRSAFKQTRAAILVSVKNLETQIENQIDFSLHSDAALLLKLLKKPAAFSQEALQNYAEWIGIDEINVFSKKGVLLASNRAAVLTHTQQEQQSGPLREFLALTEGTQNFVKQKFRRSLSESSLIAKYIGVPFPGRKGFLQLGYTLDRLVEEFSTFFFPMFDQVLVGESGFFLVTDSRGKIIAPVAGHPGAEGKNIYQLGMPEETRTVPENSFFEARIFNTYGQCFRCPSMGKWRIYAFLPNTEFYLESVSQICAYAFVLFIVCIAFRLAMVRIARAQKKLDDMRNADMELAAQIQDSELPEKGFENAHFRIRAKMTPAREVGGDFYDYYELADGRVVVTIADVSGKGVPAAIFMMKAKNMLKNLICTGTELAQSVQNTNEQLNKNNLAAMFVTAWVGIYNPADGILHYVSAGHNPPLILRRDAAVQWLKSSLRQKPLAAFSRSAYQEERISLAPGDRLYLYTDGVTEAMNNAGELFGEARLEAELKTMPDDLILRITQVLETFISDAPVADDITMLTLEVTK